jgi:hypothetical protein
MTEGSQNIETQALIGKILENNDLTRAFRLCDAVLALLENWRRMLTNSPLFRFLSKGCASQFELWKAVEKGRGRGLRKAFER